ncbi:MAG: OmpH family outer membrane protein, partial [Proteobacteria bacterium]|nr:OmpH family outer membrane protein [Pseudomonadota bacterium]
LQLRNDLLMTAPGILRHWLIAALCVLSLSGGLAGSATAQQMEPTVVAVVDLQHLMRASQAGQTIESQMESLRQSFADTVTQQEGVLRQEERDLQEQAALLAPDVLAERRRQFEEKVVELQRDVRNRQQGLEQTYAGGVGHVRQVIIDILTQMIEERGIDLVVPQTAVLVGTRTLDITDDVLARLDQELPSVTLTPQSGN